MAVGSDELIQMEVRLRDHMTAELKRLGLQTQKTQRTASSAFMKMSKSAGRLALKFVGITTAVMGLGAGIGAIVAMFGKVRQGMTDAMGFSKGMAEIGTISEEVRHDMAGTTQAVLDLSTAFGQHELKTAKGLYQTISAGVTDLQEALYLMEQASRLAVGGFAEINVVVDFLTGVINAYGKSVYEAEELTDIFFETVRLGKTTIPEMAKQMGAVMPIAANLGVSIKELSAMLATLTLGNIETTLATTYMRQALVAVLQPSEEAQTLMAANKFEFTTAKIAADGFVGVLKEMREKFKGNIGAMQKFFPNVRSFIPVLALAGKQWDKFNEILKQFDELGNKAVTPTMQALETAMLSAGKKMEVMGNAARQGFMQLGMGLIEGITGPINSVKDLQDMAFVFRDAVAGLKPIVEGMVAGMIAAMGGLVWAFKQLAPELAESDAEARVLEEDLGNLSTVMFNMARSVMGGGKSIGEAFADMSHSLRSGRKELVMNALDARDAVEEMAGSFTGASNIDTWSDGGEFGNQTLKRWSDLSLKIREMSIKDIPQSVLSGSGELEGAIREYQESFALNPEAFDIWGITSVEQMLGQIGKATAHTYKEIGNELAATYKELTITNEAAASRLGHELGTRNQEIHRMLSMEDVINRASADLVTNFEAYGAVLAHTDFTMPGGAFGAADPLMGIDPGTVQAAAAAYEAAGKGGGEAYYTALAFEMEGDLEQLPDELKKIMGPKYEAAMGWLASKGGDTFKDALKVAGGGLTFGDLIVSDPGRESALTQEIYNITAEIERQKLLMNDTTGIQKQEKELYLLEMTVKLRRREIELAHRKGDQSKTLWKQDQEAMDASIGRAKHQIKVIGDLNLATADYSEQIALVKAGWEATTDEEKHLKKQEMAWLELQKAVLANEIAMESGKRTWEDYMAMIVALSTGYQRLKAASDLSEEFRKTNEAMQEQIFLVEAGWDESTIESFTNKSLELARLRHESDVAEYRNRAELAKKSTEEIDAHVAAMGVAYKREVDQMINGSYKLGSAWDELIRDANKLQEKFEKIGVEATNMMVDGLTEGMLMMAKGADEANRSWKDFSRNFLNQIAMMIMRLYMMQAVMQAMNFIGGGGGPMGDGVPANIDTPLFHNPLSPEGMANGGIVPGGLGRMVGYANGGPIVSGPHMAVIGEGRHSEAVVPLPDGKSIPVQMAGGGGTSVNISIQAVDAKGVDELLVSRQDTLRNIIRQAMTESRSFRSSMMGQTRG